jgi:predicted aspartyl protease
MPRYGAVQTKSIPAPEVSIFISLPSQTRTIKIPAILDTGAARTCIPQGVFDRLGAEEYDWAPMRVAAGPVAQVIVLDVKLEVLECEFKDLRVGVIPRDYALIGRDILNNYVITLDAKGGKWSVDRYSV